MDAAPVRVNGRFRMRRKTPVAIEPRACLAEYEPAATRSRCIRQRRSPASSATRCPPRSTCPATGCAWSRPTSAAASAARARSIRRRFSSAPPRGGSARPVKWTSDRMEDLCRDQPGASTRSSMPSSALDARRHDAVALRADVIGDVGAYSIYPWTAALEPVQVVSFLPGPYRIEHYRGRVRAVATSKAPTGPYRGVGRPISTFVMERLMDMAAARLGLDAEGDPPAQSRPARASFPTRSPPASCGTSPASSNASMPPATRSATTRCAQQGEARAAGRWFGIGIACYAELTGIGSRISVAPGMPINTGTETADHSHRFDRRDHCRFRRRLARTGTGDDTRADRCRAPRRALRGCPHRAGRQCRRAWRHRHLCEPEPVLAGGAATLAARVGAREGAQCGLASARSIGSRSCRRRGQAFLSPAPIAR